ncbi:MAG: hypothetical protein QNJ73_06520 [Gammaproteobacteria bacterium]|nr:hypothetical protein [Gammaproteobacteria bacterium]
MHNKFAAFISVLLMVATGTPATAETVPTVALLPASTSVTPGESFTIDLVLDVSDVAGESDLISGEVIVDFDGTLAQFDGFAVADPVMLFSGPTTGTAGNGNVTVSLGLHNAPPVSVLGTFSFTAAADAPAGPIDFGLDDAFPFLGSFATEPPTNQPIFPDFSNTSVAVVPLPAAGWLLLSALGLTGWWQRRCSRARA